ncbi:BnaA09g15370D [Brassica napus]|uniref:BnaA09g15370D protein n=1 Tax=Brassica napus TaxID=3708 RepID=A0A078HWC8_BRANA|nr:BnaA09g15370D [Brassica napus]
MEVSALKLPIHKHRYRCNDSGCYNNANPGGWFHKECGESPSEINHPSHPEHPLTFNAKTGYKRCHLCGLLIRTHVLYHCSKCNFSICIDCKRNPPPLTVQHTKTHRHTLSLLARRVSFTCNVCGMQGDRSPYSCIQCSFLVHRDCIDLPRVININRHDHRISLTDHIGRRGNLKCGVCHQSVNQYCGGYTCSTCPDFVVHSSCPTKHRVWDGVELQGIPEEEEVIPPFKVVGDNLIKHFSHENHILRLESDGTSTRDEKTRCEACVSPVYSDPVYSCEQCGFILHETCANLPRKKRLPFRNIEFKLYAPDMDSYEAFECYACKTMFSGFRYKAYRISIDVRCGTFSELESYDFHDHPAVYYNDKKASPRCRACHQRGEMSQHMLSCDDCDFALDFRCFNLPRVVKHKDDEPPLSLCYGEDPNGNYWCDICEGETNPKDWFYTCSHSGVTLHVQCVLGDFSFLMPRRMIKYRRYCKFEVVPNDHCSRPFCACCQSRCIGPFFLTISNPEIIYICSEGCLKKRSLSHL